MWLARKSHEPMRSSDFRAIRSYLRGDRSYREVVSSGRLRLARFYARLEARVFRPALTAMNAPPIESNAPLSKALQTIDAELDRFFAQAFPGRKAA